MSSALPSHLDALGWNARLQQAFDDLGDPRCTSAGRVSTEHRGSYVVISWAEDVRAEVSGRFQHTAASRMDFPVVGDWVALEKLAEDRAVIHAVLPRASVFSRKVAGLATEEQLIASNIDTVFLTVALDQEPNLRRIERYLTVTWDSGAIPVVLLTKADLWDDIPGALEQVAAVAPGAEVHAVSCADGRGLGGLDPYLGSGSTIAVLGSSGAGKSTLINRLIGGDVQEVAEIRRDGKGRHTTTRRELLPLPGGGTIIDTPGMRELQLWDGDAGVERTFEDVTSLAPDCRFNDCSHQHEPGCAVLAAVGSGHLAEERLLSYRKQLRELAAIARKKDKRLASEERKKWKTRSVEARARTRIR